MLDRMGVLHAGLIGVALALLRPKNLAVDAAAAMAIAETGIALVPGVVVYLCFTAVSTLGIGVPLAVSLGMGARADAVLCRWKDWLTTHQAAVLSAIYVVFGGYLVLRGLLEIT
jgi:hypothetical protein